MCGIAGFVQREAVDGEMPRMLTRLAHRGPDGQGIWQGRAGDLNVVLGHRRLSIIDLSGGTQPMAGLDGAVQCVFNGEIYNYRALRRRLELAGAAFTTESDTEALLHLVARTGEAELSALDGMFAFALWDARSRRLLLARDRAGIKPLYWFESSSGTFGFASELSALLAHPDAPRRISTAGLTSFLFADYAHAPLTLVDGIHKLEPGHFLVWTETGASTPRAFWQLAPVPPRSGNANDLARELETRLEGAVERQLVSDVPVGVFLSGGLDSSLVTSLARKKYAGALRTFSIGFADRAFDESSYARLVAAHLGTRHVERIIDERDLLESVDEVLACLDEPMADHSIVPTFLLSRLAASEVKVVLGGDGADELWAGYPTYRAARYARTVKAIDWTGLAVHAAKAAVRRLPVMDGYQPLDWKLKRFFGRWDDDAIARHLRWLSSVDLGSLLDVLPGATMPPATLGAHYPAFESVNRLLAVDFLTYLPGSVLTKVDRASMAHGLEVRPPLLDNDLIDWAFSIPSEMKLHRGTTKYLLRRVAKRHLPPAVLQRSKRGFSVPLSAWLRGPLAPRVDRMLASDLVWDETGLDRSVVRRWAGEHRAKRMDHAKPLWALIVLHDWLTRVLHP